MRKTVQTIVNIHESSVTNDATHAELMSMGVGEILILYYINSKYGYACQKDLIEYVSKALGRNSISNIKESLEKLISLRWIKFDHETNNYSFADNREGAIVDWAFCIPDDLDLLFED